MKPVSAILKSKPDQSVWVVSPFASAYDAIVLMAEKNIGAVLVLEHDRIVGVLSERDYARRLALKDLPLKATLVRDIMSTPVMSVSPAQTNEECMALMTNSRLRHLPVVDGGQLVGLVSIGDLVKDIISELEFTIDQLQRYVTGKRD